MGYAIITVLTTKVTTEHSVLKTTCCSHCPYNSKVLFFTIRPI